MAKVLVFGATGNLEKEIARNVIVQGYLLAIVARNKKKAAELSHSAARAVFADVIHEGSLKNHCAGDIPGFERYWIEPAKRKSRFLKENY